ncbi:NAD(P)-binding protein [Rhizobiales bacterium TNE-4]|nr:NAD(P)-binding protein [Rhizobiales bacterium TNE-4]MBV1827557.1 NAD(P)-binding protein [Rhizobiales bacterium TNE-4]
MVRVLVVGAGFAGAIYSRVLAENGFHVSVIDRRSHIAGNCYDFLDLSGVRVHKYGPHLFHTNNQEVFDWLSRFTQWVEYEHRVQAKLPSGAFTPLPINRLTINSVFDLKLSDEAEVIEFLRKESEPYKTERPGNAADYLNGNIGKLLTDLFFRPYTKKMWNLNLEELSSSVVRRIPIRYDCEDRYFPSDKIQVLPENGYTALFENIFQHDNIEIKLGLPFEKDFENDFSYVFNSMAIDEYFGFSFGALPYRSIKFHLCDASDSGSSTASVVNYTDSGAYTRETHWYRLPGNVAVSRVKSVEEPCDYRDNNFERYYPVKTADDRYQALYKQYKQEADKRENINFIGRCGTYQYLDMDQVVNQSLLGVRRFISSVR